MEEDKWKLKEGEGSTCNTREQYGWRKLSEFYGRWILGMGTLKPVQLTPEFCEKHDFGCKECVMCEEKDLIFGSEQRAKDKIRSMLSEMETKRMVEDALDAWWNPEKYYKLSKR
jgi:hypothetical protein